MSNVLQSDREYLLSNGKCAICGKADRSCIHHERFQLGTSSIGIDKNQREALTVLCDSCHSKLHHRLLRGNPRTFRCHHCGAEFVSPTMGAVQYCLDCKLPSVRNLSPVRQIGRWPDSDWDLIRSAAKAGGKTVAQWAREILLRAARRSG